MVVLKCPLLDCVENLDGVCTSDVVELECVDSPGAPSGWVECFAFERRGL